MVSTKKDGSNEEAVFGNTVEVCGKQFKLSEPVQEAMNDDSVVVVHNNSVYPFGGVVDWLPMDRNTGVVSVWTMERYLYEQWEIQTGEYDVEKGHVFYGHDSFDSDKVTGPGLYCDEELKPENEQGVVDGFAGLYTVIVPSRKMYPYLVQIGFDSFESRFGVTVVPVVYKEQVENTGFLDCPDGLEEGVYYRLDRFVDRDDQYIQRLDNFRDEYCFGEGG